MFVCRLDDVFGVGDTPMGAFEDMVETMDLGVLDTPVEPTECEFFEQIEVSIRETKTWSIESQYEFVDD